MKARTPLDPIFLLTAIVVCAAAIFCAAQPADAIVTVRSLDYETGNFSQWAGVNAIRGRATIVRSPRRWVRVAAAGVVAGTGAGTLVLVRARQKHKQREARGLRAITRGGHEVADEVRRRLSR